MLLSTDRNTVADKGVCVRRLSIILATIVAGVSLYLLRGCGPADTVERPNVLLITLCSIRPDHMSAYGYRRDTTPHLKAMASESIVFEHAATPWPKTVPAIASLMTGQYGHTNGVMRFTPGQVLNNKHETLAEILAASGYETAAFISSAALHGKTNLFQGFETAVGTYRKPNPFVKATEQALAWLKDRREKPFFIWVHYNNAHYRYDGGGAPPDMFVDDEYYDASRRVKCNTSEPLAIPVANPNGAAHAWEVTRATLGGVPHWVVLDERPEEFDFYVARYDAGIFAADAQIGRLVQAAREIGSLQNTIIAVVGDHGEALGEHDYFFEHGRFPYDDCVRVPMMIRLASDAVSTGVVPAAIRVKAPVGTFSLAPTLLEMIGIRPPAVWDAESLLDLMRGGSGPRFVFTESGYQRDFTISVRERNWKLIHVPNPVDQYLMNDTEYELYHLSNDPRELINLYEQQPDVAARLRQTLSAWSQPWIAEAYGGPLRTDIELDPKIIEELRSLGYVE